MNFRMPKINFSGGNLLGNMQKPSGEKAKPKPKIVSNMSTKQMIMYGCAGLALIAAIAFTIVVISSTKKDDESASAAEDDYYTQEDEYTVDENYVADDAAADGGEVRNMLTDATINGKTLDEPVSTYETTPVEQVSYVSTSTPYDDSSFNSDSSSGDIVPISTPVPIETPAPTPEPTPVIDQETCSHIYEPAGRTEPTCSQEGSIIAKCKKCGKEITAPIPKLAHIWGETVTLSAPACNKEGKGEHTCKVCGEKESVTIPATGHSWGDWEVTTEPTCQKGGVETRVCKNCKQKETRTIGKAEHETIVYTTVEPTCEEEGLQETVCINCDKTIAIKKLSPLGHKYEITSQTAPTCETAGRIVRTCQRKDCGAVKETTIPALGHDMQPTFIMPTCKDEGFCGRECANGCGKREGDTIDPIASHNYKVAKIPAIGKDGKGENGYARCTICDDILDIPYSQKYGEKTYSVDKEPGYEDAEYPNSHYISPDYNMYGYTVYETADNAHGYIVYDYKNGKPHEDDGNKEIMKFATDTDYGYEVTYGKKSGNVIKVRKIDIGGE